MEYSNPAHSVHRNINGILICIEVWRWLINNFPLRIMQSRLKNMNTFLGRAQTVGAEYYFQSESTAIYLCVVAYVHIHISSNSIL